MKKIRRHVKGFVFGFIVLMFLTNFSIAGIKPGPCEIALLRCIQDPFWMGLSEGVFHCALGYIFCKKYIDSL